MGFIIKLVRGIINFWVSSAALVVLYFADMAAVALAYSIQEKIPVIEKAARNNFLIAYILPAIAIFFVSLVFVKINQNHFHLTLGKIVFRYLALMVLLVGLVVLVALIGYFIWSVLPENAKTMIINIVGTPFAFLVVASHGSILLIPLIIIGYAAVFCVIVPLSLIAGFGAASFYEKLPNILKIAVKIASVVCLVLFVKYLVNVGTTITDDDIFNRTYTTKKDAAFLEKLHKQGFDFNEKKMLQYLVKYDSPEFIIEQVISYGVDVKACYEEFFADKFYCPKPEIARVLFNHGADLNVRFSDGEPYLFRVLNDYEMLKFMLEKGADVNIKYENHTGFINGASNSNKVTQNAGMYYFDNLLYQRNEEGWKDIIKLLCEYGLDMYDYKEEFGRSAIDYANHFGRWLSYKVSMKRTSWEEPYYMIIEKGDKSWSVGIPYLKKPMFLDAVYPRNFAETKDGFTVHFYFFGSDMNYNYSDDFYFKEIDGEPCLYQIEDNFNISTWNEDKKERDILETETKIKPISPVIKISDLTADRVETLLDAYSRAK